MDPAQQMFLEMLGRLMAPQNDVRHAAEEVYNQMKESSPEQVILSLVNVLAGSTDIPARIMSAILLRQEVMVPTSDDDEWVWRSLSPQAQEQAKAGLMRVLETEPQGEVRRKIGDTLAALAVSVLSLKDNSWPALFPFLLNLSKNENPELRASALSVFSYIANRLPTSLEDHFEDFLAFLREKLGDPSVKVRLGCMGVIYGLLSIADEPPRSIQLQTLVPGVLEGIAAALHANDEECARTAIEYLTEMADFNIKFLRPHILNVIELMLSIAKSDQLDDTVRHLGVEMMVTIAEAKPGMARKIPNFLQEIFSLMLNWGTHLEENPEWNQGESADIDDMDAAIAEESLDRLSMALGGETVAPLLFSAIPAFLRSEDWRHRHAGLISISVSAEGCVKYLSAHLQDVVMMILPFFKDPHPRVRWAASNAIAQMCSDFQPEIQIAFHNPILSATIQLMDDKENPRVVSHAASLIVNFCEECQPEILVQYLKTLLEKLHGLLGSPRIVQEQVITAIASIADCVGLEFTPYYDYFVPFLKEILNTAHAKEFNLLRSKAMECVSIIGVAVGKERFAQDSQEIIQILSRIQFQPNDPEMPSMQLAWARLCKCLGKDFQPYLEMVMPGLLQLARIEPEMEIVDSENIEQFDSEGWELLPLGEKTVCIKTSALEEKSTAINILFCFADELKECFFPWIQPVAEILVPSMTFGYHDGVRNTAASTMPCLITSTLEFFRLKGEEGNMEPAVTLWNFMQPNFLKAIRKEIDVDAHVAMLESYSECLDLLEDRSHTPESLKAANETFHKILTKYLKARNIRADSVQGEEDFDEIESERLEDQNKREDDVVALLAETVGKLFKTYKHNYIPFFAEYAHIWKELISSSQRPRDSQLAMCIFDDIGEHLEQDATPFVQDLFQLYGQMCTHSDSDCRQAAVFGLGVFAQFCGQAFGPFANTVANALCQVASDPNSRLPENVHATENAISALGKICLFQADSVNLQKFTSAFVSFLPVSEDKEESHITYRNLCLLIERNGPMLLGQSFDQLVHILKVFGSILGTELIGDEVAQQVVMVIKGIASSNENAFKEACSRLGDSSEKLVAALNM